MIELNRKLYMDESTGKKNHRFDNLRGKLSEIFILVHAFMRGSREDAKARRVKPTKSL